MQNYLSPKIQTEFISDFKKLLTSNISFIYIRTVEENRFLSLLASSEFKDTFVKNVEEYVNKLKERVTHDDIININEKIRWEIKTWDGHLGLVNLLDSPYKLINVDENIIIDDEILKEYQNKLKRNESVSEEIVNQITNSYMKKVTQTERHEFEDLIDYLENGPTNQVIIIKDSQNLFKTPLAVRALLNLEDLLVNNGIILLFVGDNIKLPVNFEKHTMVIDMPLPDEDLIKDTLKSMINSYILSIPLTQQEKQELGESLNNDVIQNCKGLTLQEIYNATAISLTLNNKLDISLFNETKKQIIKKNGLLEVFDPVPEDQVGGLKLLKQYVKSRKNAFLNRPELLNGILLVGAPGVGKSLSAKVVSSIYNVPLIRLDISSLKNSLVGQSEANLRNALKQIDASAPCVVWIDEIEKLISGVQSSGRSDSGTTSSMFAQLLFWMQEKQTSTYIVATCNDIDDILQISQGAMLRRFDDIFYLQFPNSDERKEILEIHKKKYDVEFDVNYVAKKTKNFTGAELEKIVKNLLFEDVDTSIKSIKPIYNQNTNKFKQLEKWAETNCRMASYENNVKMDETSTTKKGLFAGRRKKIS